MTRRCDTELLVATRAGEAEAFGELFRRHEDTILAFLVRRTRTAETAVDLTAETFAAALLAVHRDGFDPPSIPVAWLLTIARHKLIDAYRKGRVEDEARREAGMSPVTMSDADVERIDALTDEDRVLRLLAELPADQQAAVRARVLEERDYPQIAAELQTSPMVVRQRVSRGLRRLRHALEAPR